jgi:hypothetical protein
MHTYAHNVHLRLRIKYNLLCLNHHVRLHWHWRWRWRWRWHGHVTGVDTGTNIDVTINPALHVDRYSLLRSARSDPFVLIEIFAQLQQQFQLFVNLNNSKCEILERITKRKEHKNHSDPPPDIIRNERCSSKGLGWKVVGVH